MARVLCAVDDSPAAGEAVRAAIAFCREHGAALKLVGVVKPSIFDPPQPSSGERVRRFNQVQFALARAAEVAREGALESEITVRAGDPAKELLREADATLTEEVFLARSRNRLTAWLTRRPRITVTRVTVAAGRPEAEVEARKVA